MFSIFSTDTKLSSSKFYFWLISLLVAMLFSAQMFFSVHQNQYLFDAKIHSLKTGVALTFQQSMHALDQRFQALMVQYSNNANLTANVKNNQRAAIHSLVKDDYFRLKEVEPSLFVMHFIDPSNKTILRMHKPHSYGDDLTLIRPIVAEVNRVKVPESGFEPGKNGITYRITNPIIDANNNHLGVLEFGILPEYFVRELEKHYPIKAQVLVKTDRLKHLTYQTNFLRVGDYSVVLKNEFFDGLKIKATEENQFIHQEDKTYLVINGLYLKSYQGEEIAQFQILEDVTEFYDKHANQLTTFILINLSVFLIFLLLLNLILRQFGDSLLKALVKLRNAEKEQQALIEISAKDELTQVYNRKHFNEVLSSIAQPNITLPVPYSVIFFDIDFFKSINDDYGHLVGDKVLLSLAAFTEQQFRSKDLLFRWGGEEFCVLLKGVGLNVATQKAEMLRTKVETHVWPQKIHFTISAGVTEIKDDDSLETLQQRVDSLLYQAKENGRNQVISE